MTKVEELLKTAASWQNYGQLKHDLQNDFRMRKVKLHRSRRIVLWKQWNKRCFRGIFLKFALSGSEILWDAC